MFFLKPVESVLHFEMTASAGLATLPHRGDACHRSYIYQPVRAPTTPRQRDR